MKIIVFYICTGKYEMFWDNFYVGCENLFYPDLEKHYFVFTDSNRILQNHPQNVETFFQRKAGWPFDTLLRFQWFLSVQDKISEEDICYYFNANSKFLKPITSNIINLPDKGAPLIFWCHTRHEDDYSGISFHPERNPNSLAFVPEGTPCRCYGGGFFGGIATEFINMCRVLRDNISVDLSKGIIAIWHDQSHLIRYAIDKLHYEVPFGLISEEEYMYSNACCLIFEAKRKYGGNDVMRGVSFRERLKNSPFKIYSKIVRFTQKIGLYEQIKYFFK